MLVAALVIAPAALATTPVAAYTQWDVKDSLYASAYLNSDTAPDRVEVTINDGATQLVITFGDNAVSAATQGNGVEIAGSDSKVIIPIGIGDSIILKKLMSADLTGNGANELIALTYDASKNLFTITAIARLTDELTLLSVPDAGRDEYKFTAAFARGYVLDLNNQTYNYKQSVMVAEPGTRAKYRDDGTAPSTLIASVSGFTDCTMAPYSGRNALELWQTISSSADNQTLGYIISTVIWHDDGAPQLVGQRYSAKQP
ncbi:hypothetical protein FACS1894184_13820 [Clostridia bacterium]|nr:hypothetical protein FACS1894184_13820 [Clostridia bacterium]